MPDLPTTPLVTGILVAPGIIVDGRGIGGDHVLHHEVPMAFPDRQVRAPMSADKHAPGDLTEPSSRAGDHCALIWAGLHVRGGAGSAMTSASGAGAMGRRP
jgi:hypothetical protein